MTEELLEQANVAQNNIRDIERVLNAIQRIKILDPNKKRHEPHLKFFNMFKHKDGKEVKEAAEELFEE